jgi:hypothetical protein
MACKPIALVVAAVVSLGSLWPPSAVGGETPAVPGEGPLCQRIPEEWRPFMYKARQTRFKCCKNRGVASGREETSPPACV